MSETKDKTPTPAFREIIKDVIYNAAFTLYFGVSLEAWNTGTVDILILDVKTPRWENTTHEFYVVFNKNAACYVGRTSAGAYIIHPDRDNPYFAQELDMRDQVLDVALQHFTGKSHLPKNTDMDRLQLAQELLEGNMTRDSRPIVQDELPAVLSPDKGETELQAERQWSVRVGHYSCAIGLFGRDDSGNPQLVPTSGRATFSGEDPLI